MRLDPDTSSLWLLDAAMTAATAAISEVWKLNQIAENEASAGCRVASRTYGTSREGHLTLYQNSK